MKKYIFAISFVLGCSILTPTFAADSILPSKISETAKKSLQKANSLYKDKTLKVKGAIDTYTANKFGDNVYVTIKYAEGISVSIDTVTDIVLSEGKVVTAVGKIDDISLNKKKTECSIFLNGTLK